MKKVSNMRKTGIAIRLSGYLLAVALVPLLIVSSITLYFSEESLNDEITDKLAIIADSKMEHIENYYSEHLRDVTILSHHPNLIEAAVAYEEAFAEGGIDSEAYRATDKEFLPIMGFYHDEYILRDIFLVNMDGDIVFSYRKEDDFATNLKTGPYKDSELAHVVYLAFSHEKVELSDYSYYGPSGEPAAFIAAPVKRDGTIIGVFAIQMPIDELHKYTQDYAGLGETGEIILAKREGDEVLFISPLRHDPLAAFQRRGALGSQEALPLQYAVQGKDGAGFGVDYRGKEIFARWHYIPLVRLGMVVKIDKEEAFEHVSDLITWSVLILAVTLAAALIAAYFLSRSISAPIVGLTKSSARLAEGDLSIAPLIIDTRDELGELSEIFRQMYEMQRNVVRQANLIAQGVYVVDVAPRSGKDELGIALQTMTGTLREIAEVTSAVCEGDYTKNISVKGPKDEVAKTINTMTMTLARITAENNRQDWLKTSQNELNLQVQGNLNIMTLAHNIIVYLANRLQAQIGALYAMDEKGGELSLVGSYAFTKRKDLNARIKIGYGLVGQAALEKETISVTNIPEDYTRIGSAIGDALPRNVLVTPFLREGDTLGVIELGSFREFNDMEIEFLNSVKDTIAVAFFSAQTRTRMQELLEETQSQTEELQAQQEELRASNEELEEQTSQLVESERRLQTQQEELQTINEELEEKTNALEEQRDDIQRKNEELESARRNLEKKAEEVATASRYKSEFLSNMSHELRTPLNSLLLLAQSLAENKDANLTDHQVESANIIHSCGTDLLSIINDILDLSKIEAGRMDVETVMTLLQDLADIIQNNFQHLADEKGLVLQIVVSPDAPQFIFTDNQRLVQILNNLMSNAIKFTEKGEVSVTFRKPAADEDLSRSGLDPKKAVAISVRDTGIGIPIEKQELIFRAFQQAEGGTARQYGGTGLGLSISRDLAKLLGGEIQLISEPGKGSTFTLFLPVERESKEEGEEIGEKKYIDSESAEDSHVSLGRYTPELKVVPDDREEIGADDRVILIIEDDLNFVRILLDQSHEKGFKCLATANGEEGLSLAERHLPDGIVLDINLPGMDGWRVLDNLKSNHRTRHIPVHIMSVEEEKIAAYQKGIIGFLTKPATKEQIDHALARLEKKMTRSMQELLIVEDDTLLRQEIITLIGNGDVQTTEAASGQEAFDALKSKKYDCVVLDLGLPDMTGFQLLDKLEQDREIDIPPVIVYTGRELTKEQNETLSRYASSIIIKGAKSAERLLDETALFLHRVVKDMPENKKKMLLSLHDLDKMFKGKTILLVDDDMRNVFALSKVLGEKGMRTLMAGEGQRALEILEKEKKIDLVLMDIMMPVMDGYETTRQIRKQAKFGSLPIIALTAKAMKDDREKCMAAGASDYLAKPVDIERLLSMLRVWLYK